MCLLNIVQERDGFAKDGWARDLKFFKKKARYVYKMSEIHVLLGYQFMENWEGICSSCPTSSYPCKKWYLNLFLSKIMLTSFYIFVCLAPLYLICLIFGSYNLFALNIGNWYTLSLEIYFPHELGNGSVLN